MKELGRDHETVTIVFTIAELERLEISTLMYSQHFFQSEYASAQRAHDEAAEISEQLSEILNDIDAKAQIGDSLEDANLAEIVSIFRKMG
jgi:hypothetical protein